MNLSLLSRSSLRYGLARGAATLVLFPGLAAAQSWSEHALTTVIPDRADHASAIEAGTNNLLVYGGLQVGIGGLADTLVFDGFRWTKRNPATTPNQRIRSAMATDVFRGVTVLFGGDSFGTVGDTWEWNGVNWNQIFPPGLTPPPRQAHAMAFDPLAGVVVLFGGNNGLSLGDTWTFNGVTWTQIALASPALPPARENHTLEFDLLTGQVLLFGGFSAPTGPMNDTWTLNTTLNGGTWTLQTPAQSPPAREDHAMEFDLGSFRMVMTGGASGATVLGDQWMWDGTTWAPATFVNTAPARRAHSLDFGPRMRLTAMGGFSGGGSFADVFSIPTGAGVPTAAVATTQDTSAPGCSTALATPRLTSDTGPLINSTYRLDLRGFDPFFPVAGVSIGFLPAAQSCIVPALGHVSANSTTVFLTGSSGAFTLPIPNNPGLAGLSFLSQAFSLDSAGTFILTNQVAATVGF